VVVFPLIRLLVLSVVGFFGFTLVYGSMIGIGIVPDPYWITQVVGFIDIVAPAF
jgi:hypothetical protein